MSAGVRRVRVRLRLRSVVLAILLGLLGLAVLVVLARSRRVVGWLLAAVTVAGLLEPVVDAVARVVPRRAALAAVALAALAAVAGVGYGTVNDVVRQTGALQRAAPREVAQLEQSERFGDLARDYRLVDRTRRIVDGIPGRLLGPTTAAAVRGVTERAVTALVVGVLSLFVLSRRRDLVAAAVRQVRDPERRAAVARTVERAYARGFGYVRGTVALAVAAGLVAFLLGRAAGVPGPAPLGIWAALWSLLPVLGALVGFAPLVVLAAIGSPATGWLVLLAVLAHQGAEALVRARWLEPRTMRLGPFLTGLALYAGLELGGVFGALVLLPVAAVATAAVDELANA